MAHRPGPIPMPTAVHRLRGNPSKLNLDKLEEQEPQPATTGLDLSAPSYLSREARAEWDDKATTLNRLGLLSEVDLDSLALYCQSMADWKQAVRKVHRQGKVVKGKLNPWVRVAEKAFNNLIRMQAEFGMSPSSRSRVKVSKKKSTDVEKDRFFGSTNPAVRGGA